MCSPYFPCLISKELDLTPKMERKSGKEGENSSNNKVVSNKDKAAERGRKDPHLKLKIPKLVDDHDLKGRRENCKNHEKNSMLKKQSSKAEDKLPVMKNTCSPKCQEMGFGSKKRSPTKMRTLEKQPCKLERNEEKTIKKDTSSSESEFESEASQVFNFTPKSLKFFEEKKSVVSSGSKFREPTSMVQKFAGSQVQCAVTGSRSHDALDTIRIHRRTESSIPNLQGQGSAFKPYMGKASKSSDELAQKPLKNRQRLEKPNPNFQYCEKPTFEKQAQCHHHQQPQSLNLPMRPKSASAVRSASATHGKPPSLSSRSCVGSGIPQKPILCSACRPKSAQPGSRSSAPHTHPRSPSSCSSGHSGSYSKLSDSESKYKRFNQSPYNNKSKNGFEPYLYVPDSLTKIGSSKTLPMFMSNHHRYPPSKLSITNMGSLETPGLYRKMEPITEQPGGGRGGGSARKVTRSKSMRVTSPQTTPSMPPSPSPSETPWHPLLGRPRKLQRSASMTVAAIERCGHCGHDINLVKALDNEVCMEMITRIWE